MANPQLLEYIKQQLALNVSKDIIRSNLIAGGGWSEPDIEEAFAAMAASQVPTFKPTPQKKNLKVILLAVIILIVLGAGLYAYMRTQNSSGTETVSKVEEPMKSGKNEIRLSNHKLSFESPWGSETAFKGQENIGQYTFSDGTKMSMLFSTTTIRDQLLEIDPEEFPEERKRYEAIIDFTESKIGKNYSDFDYVKFIRSVSQETVDTASPIEKPLYKEILSQRQTLSLINGPATEFAAGNIRGFIYGNAIDLWDSRGGNYRLGFPANQNVTADKLKLIADSIKAI